MVPLTIDYSFHEIIDLSSALLPTTAEEKCVNADGPQHHRMCVCVSLCVWVEMVGCETTPEQPARIRCTVGKFYVKVDTLSPGVLSFLEVVVVVVDATNEPHRTTR